MISDGEKGSGVWLQMLEQRKDFHGMKPGII